MDCKFCYSTRCFKSFWIH